MAGEFAGGFFKFGAENLIRFVSAGESHNADGWRQGPIGGEVVESGNEFAMREVARGTKNNECARIWNRALGKALAERIGAQSFGWHFALLPIGCGREVQSGKKPRAGLYRDFRELTLVRMPAIIE